MLLLMAIVDNVKAGSSASSPFHPYPASCLGSRRELEPAPAPKDEVGCRRRLWSSKRYVVMSSLLFVSVFPCTREHAYASARFVSASPTSRCAKPCSVPSLSLSGVNINAISEFLPSLLLLYCPIIRFYLSFLSFRPSVLSSSSVRPDSTNCVYE